jgi:thiamine biosynthesis lipoprotein
MPELLLASPDVADAHIRVMGTEAHLVVVDGDDEMVRLGEARLRELERRWSRFVPTSEVSALGRHAGSPVLVSRDTIELVQRSIVAWKATGGLFDPTVAHALAALGYDRDFADVVARTAPSTDTAAAPGMAGVVVDDVIDAVTLPPGVALDPGGIGKGLAADLTVAALLEAGAAGALVNVGGDLRAAGRPPTPEGWPIAVADPTVPGGELLRLAFAEGAVATSSRRGRRWQTTTGSVHHLLDPRSGRPIDNGVVAVCVVAAEAWWAEALTKFVSIEGAAALGTLEGAHALVVTEDGTRRASPGLEPTLR